MPHSMVGVHLECVDLKCKMYGWHCGTCGAPWPCKERER